jgi:hypothetical protein
MCGRTTKVTYLTGERKKNQIRKTNSLSVVNDTVRILIEYIILIVAIKYKNNHNEYKGKDNQCQCRYWKHQYCHFLRF